MGDRYGGLIECPYCKKKTEFYFAPTCGFTKETCEYCKKTFEICLEIVGKKIEKKKPKK